MIDATRWPQFVREMLWLPARLEEFENRMVVMGADPVVWRERALLRMITHDESLYEALEFVEKQVVLEGP